MTFLEQFTDLYTFLVSEVISFMRVRSSHINHDTWKPLKFSFVRGRNFFIIEHLK